MRELIPHPWPTMPVIITGNYWYGVPVDGTASTVTATSNRGYVTPLVVPRPCRLAGIAAQVTTAGSAGAVLRAGLYNYDAAQEFPTTLVADYGTQVATTNGVKVWTPGTPPTLVPGTVYGLMVASQGAAATQPIMRSRSGSSPLLPVETVATPVGTAVNSAWFFAGISGALATLAAPTGVTAGPVMEVSFSAA